jgi:hypothetical protein
MVPWWKDLIKLWESQDDIAALTGKSKRPGIHYAAKKVLNHRRLVDDIGAVLERGLKADRAPAGLKVGSLRKGSVGLGFSHAECEHLYSLGINPIITRNGLPYVWGQMFFNDGQTYRIADQGLIPGLTPEFRKFIAKPLLQMGFLDPVYDDLDQVESQPVAYTEQQKAVHRAINLRPKAFGLMSLETREV